MNESELVRFRPIGVVRTEVSDDLIREGRGKVHSAVEIYPEFEEGLDGIEGFSHIFVIAYLHKLRPEQTGVLKVRPRRLVKKGFKLEELPEAGVFALDSPTRPNPIGLSLVRLVRRDRRSLIVSGLDYFDGTPVLDIKGYQPDYRADEYNLPSWYTKLLEKAGHI